MVSYEPNNSDDIAEETGKLIEEIETFDKMVESGTIFDMNDRILINTMDRVLSNVERVRERSKSLTGEGRIETEFNEKEMRDAIKSRNPGKIRRMLKNV